MKKGKSIYDTYKPYFIKGKGLVNVNIKVASCIILYAINKLRDELGKNKNILNETETAEFKQELIYAKTNNLNDIKCEIEDFVEFLEHSFANVNDEDLEGEVTSKTANRFKTLSEFINVLESFGPIDENWMEKSKKFYNKENIVNIRLQIF